MGLSSGHWLYIVVILLIVLVIWGPGKLPDVGAGLGRAIREFRKATTDTKDSFTSAVMSDPAKPADEASAAPPAAPPAESPEEQKVSH